MQFALFTKMYQFFVSFLLKKPASRNNTKFALFIFSALFAGKYFKKRYNHMNLKVVRQSFKLKSWSPAFKLF